MYLLVENSQHIPDLITRVAYMSTKAVNLSIVIVNFRTPQMVIDCLLTLMPELQDIDARVVIVDNNSGDGSYDCIQSWVAENDFGGVVLVIQSADNAGFSSGNNIGINAVKAEHYLLLNSDTLVRPGAIKVLLDTANTLPGTGLVSPRLERPNEAVQENCFHFHNDPIVVILILWYWFVVNKGSKP